MGLRTASLRRPHAAAMAPALTDAARSRDFSARGPAEPACSPVGRAKGDGCRRRRGRARNGLADGVEAGGRAPRDMSASPPPADDDRDGAKMGLQRAALNCNGGEPKAGDARLPTVQGEVDHLFNMAAALPENVCPTGGDLTQNVEEIMQQVIKSIEGGKNDLNEEVFQMAGADLTNNLSSFEKQLLEDVDVMNITMEDEQEAEHRLKESKAGDLLSELRKKHCRVQRRLDFLRRRVYKLKSRHVGQHVGSEIAGVFEQVHRSIKRPRDSLEPHPAALVEQFERPRPMSYSSTKTLVRKLEMTTALQANTASRQKQVPKYFGSGSIELPPARSGPAGTMSIPPWKIERKLELQKVAGLLQTELGLVQREVDSEATESSSGDESCDELQTYSNPHQQYLTIQKRALWRYSTERAAIAARWTWLQSQIADLEYRIRQHTDLYRQARASKGAVRLEAEPPPSPPSSPAAVNGYRGALPGQQQQQQQQAAKGEQEAAECCARARPLAGGLRKRRLLQVAGLHAVSKKAARPSTVRCQCAAMAHAPCALCTGRTDATHPRPPPDTLGRTERVALLDPAFHPVFSMPEDTSQTLHMEAIMKTAEWQQRSTRMKSLKILSKSDRLEQKSLEQRQKKLEHQKKYERLKSRSMSAALSEKIKNKIRGRKAKKLKKRHAAKMALAQLSSLSADEEVESLSGVNASSTTTGHHGSTSTARHSDSPSTSPLLQMQSISGLGRVRNRTDSYDIDNIVIPYSVAASTRVEKLQYKEILTPKWRMADPEFPAKYDKNNGVVTNDGTMTDSDAEDVTEEAVTARHDRCEHDEKKKFLQYLRLPPGYGRRPHRRADSVAESSGANTPDPMSPHGADGPGSPPPPADEPPLPSVAAMARRRTVSQSQARRCGEETEPAAAEVPPYDPREFPLGEDTYEGMLGVMPEEGRPATNSRSQDLGGDGGPSERPRVGPAAAATTGPRPGRRPGSPDSESTESAVGVGDFDDEDADADEEEEDPNDPEWSEAERARRERHGRR